MVWGITGNSQKKNQKSKQDQGQRNITSIPASTMAQQVRNPPAMQETQETWVRSLGQEVSPGEGNGNPLQYSCLENPMEADGLQSMGLQRVRHD